MPEEQKKEEIIYVKQKGEITEEDLAQISAGLARKAVSSTYNPILVEEGCSGADKDYAMI